MNADTSELPLNVMMQVLFVSSLRYTKSIYSNLGIMTIVTYVHMYACITLVLLLDVATYKYAYNLYVLIGCELPS